MDETERIAALETKVAVLDERLKNIVTALESNTEALREISGKLTDCPVYRERVNNMWKLATGAISTALAAIGASVWALISAKG